MKACACPPRYKCAGWMRAVALAESRALRLLVAAHGQLPQTAPTRWDAA